MTWVLLRGLMREQRHWGQFLAQFQAATGEPVISIDFPGNGQRYQEASASNIDSMVEHCRQQLAAQQVSTPVNLLALSLGAMVGVAWAHAYPAELQHLVLINTSLAPHNPFYQRLRPQNYPAILRTMLLGSASEREALILRITSKQSDTRRAATLIRDWVSYAEECPISRKNMLRQLWAAMRYRAPMTPPAPPVLMLAGAGDQLVHPACSATLAKKWHAAIRIHPEAGHDLPLDDSEWVTEQVMLWLQNKTRVIASGQH